MPKLVRQLILFGAPSMHGKTTTAAAFAAAGHRLLAEDTVRCRIAPAALYPGPSVVRLREDVAAQIAIPGAEAETMPGGRWSFSVFRANFDRRQGLTDVNQIGFTGAVALGDRVELFGSWRTVRLDRDVRPTFIPAEPEFGGVSQEYPYLRRGWSKTLGGPIIIGTTCSLISPARGLLLFSPLLLGVWATRPIAIRHWPLTRGWWLIGLVWPTALVLALHPDEPRRIAERQRLEQQRVDDAEDGGVGADA